MAKAGEQVVGRTCTYKRADGRLVPAVIRVDNGATVNLEVFPLGSSQTHNTIAEMTARDETNVWLPGSEYRYPAT